MPKTTSRVNLVCYEQASGLRGWLGEDAFCDMFAALTFSCVQAHSFCRIPTSEELGHRGLCEQPGGGISVLLIENSGPIPAAASDNPYGAITVDRQHHSVEVAQVLRSLRRRFNFASIPTLLLGGIGEIEEFCCAVSLACGCHWAGEVRPVDVYTSTTSNQFTFQCRRLLCMVPTGRYVC